MKDNGHQEIIKEYRGVENIQKLKSLIKHKTYHLS